MSSAPKTQNLTTKQRDKAEAIERLRGWLTPGDTVYTILRNVSASGMRREIGIVIPTFDQRPCDCHSWPAAAPHFIGEPCINFLHPNHAVATAVGYKLGKRDGVFANGCGMDMGFDVVYNLCRVLWPHGFGCVGERCHSNDHSNGDRNRTLHTCTEGYFPEQHGREYHKAHVATKDGGTCHWHTDGGCALRHSWL